MSFNTSTQPPIAIIGCGLGGLALLLTLHRRGIPATVYERDASFDARAHLGGSLDLGWKSGQRALRENGLQDEFDKHSRPEGEEMRICDSTGKVHLKLGGEDEEGPGGPPQGKEDIRPEIDRTVLRKLLLDAVPTHLVQWDHALSSVRALGNGQHELTFANGITATCDLLVGADGAHSRVRPLLSSATPQFLGVNGAEISLAPSGGDAAWGRGAPYESMCAMAGRVAAKANGTLEVCVGPGTPQAAIKRFGSVAASGEREG
ncbi:hypothetical protein GSI_02669 [Ganoderma sinense ZZ0214-1]|uniref:FAD-binding domain-containing protein n=1 Tax=Ganoderma sinense ZZ0214-1 TaxID=1077348 RepID=A0A2G8SM89_9APHY|nr:hypothetical protein GSI_02669 [Ganoderma sinense ZZ0214-1]